MASTLPAEATAAALAHVVRRRWVRRETPLWPFVWRGLLPLLGLLALGRYAFESFAPHDVQANVHHEVRAALDGQGFDWVQLDVSGQNVALSGEQPAPGRGDAALLLARLTTCPSWAGRLPCAIDVTGRFTGPSASAAPTAPAPAQAESASSAAPAMSSGVADASPTATRAAQAARACEAELAAIVALSKIEFDAAAATLKPGSASVLSELAKAALDCPGVIRIEGHTDSTGAPQANRVLSEARAEAVRRALIERGLPAERLRAEGFGEDKPVADNGSAEGRAKNRRIEFRIATGN